MFVWTSLRAFAMPGPYAARGPRGRPLRPRGTMNVTLPVRRRDPRKRPRCRGLRAVALLKFLARAAPARVVAADLLGRLHAPLLDDRGDLLGDLGRIAVRGHA